MNSTAITRLEKSYSLFAPEIPSDIAFIQSTDPKARAKMARIVNEVNSPKIY